MSYYFSGQQYFIDHKKYIKVLCVGGIKHKKVHVL